jgi:hypothetical protein
MNVNALKVGTLEFLKKLDGINTEDLANHRVR